MADLWLLLHSLNCWRWIEGKFLIIFRCCCSIAQVQIVRKKRKRNKHGKREKHFYDASNFSLVAATECDWLSYIWLLRMLFREDEKLWQSRVERTYSIKDMPSLLCQISIFVKQLFSIAKLNFNLKTFQIIFYGFQAL